MRNLLMTAVVLMLLVQLVGCTTVVVNHRDDDSILKLQELKGYYLQDLATAISDEDAELVVDPMTIGEETEFSGDLIWEEVEATIGVFDAAIAYEEAKVNPGDEDEEVTEEAPAE